MQAELSELFFDKAKAFAAANNMPVSEPNISFDPKAVAGTFYLKVFALPSEPEVFGVNNGESRYGWTLQASIYARDGIGEIKSQRYAEELRTDVFPIFTQMVGDNHKFKVVKPASPAEAVQMGAWYSVPIRFRVETFD